jgi:hypothetical protein
MGQGSIPSHCVPRRREPGTGTGRLYCKTLGFSCSILFTRQKHFGCMQQKTCLASYAIKKFNFITKEEGGRFQVGITAAITLLMA